MQPKVAGGGGGGGGVQTTGLLIEAYDFDATANKWVIESYGDLLQNVLGAGVSVQLPDLYADDGSDLYGVVNLETFLNPPIPTFTPGQNFTINGGLVAALPGYEFFTTVPVFNENAPAGTDPWGGSVPPDGLTATFVTDHDPMSSTPEPASLALVASGAMGLLLARRRQRRR